VNEAPDLRETVAHYDRVMYAPAYVEYHEQSDFANFGWWEPGTTSQRRACEALMEKLLALFPDKRGSILDVACGKGATTRHLARHYPPARVFAINLSGKQLETSRANAPGCHFAQMDAARLGLADDSIDNMLCVEAAFHFVTREAFLGEAHRVLRPGGRLVLTDMLMTREAERRRFGRIEENYVPDLDAYRALCARAGFDEVDVADATGPCWHGCYRHVVGVAHEKFLAGQFDRAELGRLLASVYGHVPDLRYYLVAIVRKGAGRGRSGA
jgi:MPBQ/MSBQ methyltransferase